MIKIIEKLFSDLIQRIILIPLYIRVIFFFYFLFIFLGIKFHGVPIKFNFPTIIINSEQIIIIFLILLTIILIATIIIRQKRKTHQIYYFAKLWYDFYDLLFILHNRIEMSFTNGKNIFNDEELLNNIKAYHEQSKKIREIIFKIGEKNLILNSVPDWIELSEQSKYIKINNYISPFSLLSNLGNPIAAVNHHGKDIWAAIHISLQFIEYLSFKYKKISKIRR